MNSFQRNVIKHKIRLLNLAANLAVSRACGVRLLQLKFIRNFSPYTSSYRPGYVSVRGKPTLLPPPSICRSARAQELYIVADINMQPHNFCLTCGLAIKIIN